jgi:hypothetical protein
MASIISAGTTSGTALNMAGDTSGQLQLATNGSTTALTIDTSQNVGIGTSSPATRLHVSRNTAGEVARFVGSTDVLGELTLTSVDNVGSGRAWGLNIVSAFGEYRWAINNTERMRIDSSGNVLVNTTTEGAGAGFATKVAISGGDALLSKTAGLGATDAFPARFWHNATSGNNLFVSFATETSYTSRGSIDYNRGANQTRYNTSSDQRLKENIVDAPSAIDLINSVKIRSFDWKETGFHVDYGVIAQELNEVAPDAVSEGIDNEDGTIKQSWGVDTSVLVPALIKSIQEQQTIINDLTARITALEGAA